MTNYFDLQFNTLAVIFIAVTCVFSTLGILAGVLTIVKLYRRDFKHVRKDYVVAIHGIQIVVGLLTIFQAFVYTTPTI